MSDKIPRTRLCGMSLTWELQKLHRGKGNSDVLSIEFQIQRKAWQNEVQENSTKNNETTDVIKPKPRKY